jgi:hypothetical protein
MNRRSAIACCAAAATLLACDDGLHGFTARPFEVAAVGSVLTVYLSDDCDGAYSFCSDEGFVSVDVVVDPDDLFLKRDDDLLESDFGEVHFDVVGAGSADVDITAKLYEVDEPARASTQIEARDAALATLVRDEGCPDGLVAPVGTTEIVTPDVRDAEGEALSSWGVKHFLTEPPGAIDIPVMEYSGNPYLATMSPTPAQGVLKSALGPSDDLFVRAFGVAEMTGVEVTLSATNGVAGDTVSYDLRPLLGNTRACLFTIDYNVVVADKTVCSLDNSDPSVDQIVTAGGSVYLLAPGVCELTISFVDPDLATPIEETVRIDVTG